MKKARAAAFVAAAIALVTGILLIPTPLRVQGTLVLKLAKPEEVYAEVEGRLVELNVKNGEWVKKDTVLAKLSNPEKQKELLQRQQDQTSTSIKAKWFGQSPEPENRAQAKQHEEFAEKLEPMIGKIADQIGKLTLVANRDGQVVGVAPQGDVGQWLKPRQAVLRGRRPSPARGAPDPRPVRHPPDQPRSHRLDQDLRQGRDDVSRARFPRSPSAIARRSPPSSPTWPSGEVASKPDPKTGAAKPLTAVYEVIIPVDNPDLDARARPPRLRQDRRRHLHARLVAAAAGGTSSSTSSSEWPPGALASPRFGRPTRCADAGIARVIMRRRSCLA